MQSFQFTLIIVSAVMFSVLFQCESLRCRTDEGPTEEDIKKIVRICMHKVGENDTENDYSDENDLDSDEKNGEVSTNRAIRHNDRQNFNRFNYQNNMQNNNQNNPYGNPNMYGQNNFGSNGHQENYNDQFQNQNPPRYNNKFNSNKTSANNNQTEQDRACLVHCFFHELKMTNNEDFPDKRKMLQILTKDIREQEVREFYVDSIQECFHMVDNLDNYNRRKNKCDVAYTIVTCLTERAKTNCEDFHNDMIIF